MTTPSLQSLTQALTSTGLPAPSASFLSPILNLTATNGGPQRTPPLPALIATARHRLLSTSLTTPNILSPSTPYLPANISNPRVTETILKADTPVQVLDIEDLSKSKWEQIETLEAERRGELTEGREVIRVAAIPADGEVSSTTSTRTQAAGANTQGTGAKVSDGPFKFLLQDVRGQKVYGFELRRLEKVGYPPTMSIGCKFMLKKGARVARGVVLLEPGVCVVLGGRIEGLDKEWREGREKRLRDAVKGETRDGHSDRDGGAGEE